ncbi:hypothetical protein, partial [Ruminococcus callidus]|uniref:hypothetical protein n=1 Tax=Ruminococcus callidus TaxID=40519 RepID=UPI0023F8EEB0
KQMACKVARRSLCGIALNSDFREFVRIAESKKIMYKFHNIPRDKNNIFEGFTSRCLKRNAV